MSTSEEQGGAGPGRVVALTGARGGLGSGLIQRLEADGQCQRVVAFDIQKPSIALTKTEFRRLDLTLPGADTQMAEVLREKEVDTFVHLAFLSDFTHRSAWAHELESIGTLHVLNACSLSRISHLRLWSHGLCYGARSSNPAFLTEEDPLRAASGPNDTFFADKIDAERQVRQFAEERPGVSVTILRMAAILQREGHSFISRMLRSRLVPVLAGYDPLVQFLHPDDAVEALHRTVTRATAGVFNIASDGLLPLRTVLALLGRVPVPVPRPLARRLAGVLWMGQAIDVPPSFLSFLKYPCVLDIDRARRELGFSPRHDIHAILADFDGRPREPPAGRPSPMGAEGAGAHPGEPGVTNGAGHDPIG